MTLRDATPTACISTSTSLRPSAVAVVRDRAYIKWADHRPRSAQPDAPLPWLGACHARRFRHDEPDA